MTPQDPIPAPTQSPPPPPRRLTRSSSDRMIFGVAGGVARHFGLDPSLVRIAFVVLTLFGGFGLAVYGVAALVVPSDDGSVGLAGTSRTQKAALAVIAIAVVVSFPFSGAGVFFFGPGLLALLVVGAVVVLVWRSLGGEGNARLVRAAWLILAVAGSVLLGLGAGAAAAFGAGTGAAVLVIAAGVTLTVGGLIGGARWLIVPALLLALPVAVVSAADLDLRGGVGEREYRPASVPELRPSYRLGAGRLRLDLRDVKFERGTTTRLSLRVGAGEIVLATPPTVCVQSSAHIGAGRSDLFGVHHEGVDIDAEQRPTPIGRAPVLVVDLHAGVGQTQVELTAADAWGQEGFQPQAECLPRTG